MPSCWRMCRPRRCRPAEWTNSNGTCVTWGWGETPVERALPVYMDLRGRGRQPRVALVLVLDKSGSMAGQKMDLTKEAAARSLEVLRPEDRAAVIAFDSAPQLVAPLTPLSE